MAAGDFTMPDNTGTVATELTTLFGVAQGVGDTPVNLTAPTTETVLGGFGPGVGPGAPGTRAPSSVQTVPGQKATVTETLQGFYGLDQAALTNMQHRLYVAGFYPAGYYGKSAKSPQFGSPDDDSFAAFKSAAVQAARSGKPLPDVISTAAAAVAAGGGPGAPTRIPPAVLQPPSPVDIRAQVVASAKEKYGHAAPESLVNHIIDEYQRATVAQQEALNTAQAVGGTVPQVPNLPAFVDQRLQQAAPGEVAMNNAGHAAALVMQAFSGGL